MTTSRNDFEMSDTPSSSIDSAAATSGVGDGGSSQSDSGTAQTESPATDRLGLLTRATGVLHPRWCSRASRSDDVQDADLGPTSGTTISRLAAASHIPQSRV